MAKAGCKYGRRKDGKCRKTPRKGAARASSKGGCKYGKLKNPVGRRKCKKRPARGRR
jgi:hypothetical protein